MADINNLDLTQDAEPTYELLDHANQKMVTVPYSDVPTYLSSGQYGIRKGTVLPVVSPDGERGTIDADNAANAFKNGFTVRPFDEVRQEQLQKQYGTPAQQILAGEEALLSSATLGISRQGENILGLETPKTQALRKEANPGTALTGEVAGIFTPGGLISLVGKAGKAVASGVARIAGTGAELAAETAAKAAEESRALTTLTAEASAKAIGKEAAAAGISKTVAQRLASAIPATAGLATEGAIFGAGNLIDENALGKADFNAENLAASLGGGALLGGALGATLGLARAAAPAVVDKAGGLLEKFTNKDKAAMELAGVRPQDLSKMSETAKENLTKYMAEEIGPEALKNRETILAKNEEVINRGEKIKSDVLDALDKNNVLVYPSHLEKEALPALDAAIENSEKSLQPSAYQSVKAKIMQDKAKIEEYINNVKKAKERIEQIGIENLTAKDWATLKNNVGASAVNDMRKFTDDIVKWSAVHQGDAPLLQKTYVAVRDALAKDVSDAAGGFSPQLKQAWEKALQDQHIGLSIQKGLEREAGKPGNFINFSDFKAMAFAHITGIHGIPVVVAKKFLESDLRRRMVVLGKIEAANQKVMKTVNSAAESFFSPTAVKAPIIVGGRSLVDSMLAKKDSGRKPKDSQEAFQNIQNRINTYAQNYDKYLDDTSTPLIPIQKHAPNTATAFQTQQHNALQFLQQKLPKKNTVPGVLNIMKQPRFSDAEMSKFNRYVQAVEQPLSVLKEIENGTATQEHVEALKTVYPNMFQSLQQTIMENTSKLANAPYEKRLQLGNLFGIVTDESMDPHNIMGLQAQFQQQQQKGGGAVKPTASGLAEVEKAGTMKSIGEEVADEET